jgi:CDP-diacylglycerol--glycerol-3-phosphate 3-phosphatidyltransferase
LIRLHITANMLTFLGVVLAAVSGLLVVTDNLFWGGALLILSAPMDAIDGTVARLSGSIKSKFGAFWDSTLDRYSEAFVLLGVLIYGLSKDNDWIIVLTFVTVVGSILVSYARSRAETLGIDCKVGIMTRLERVVVTILMLLLNPLYPDVQVDRIGANGGVHQRDGNDAHRPRSAGNGASRTLIGATCAFGWY